MNNQEHVQQLSRRIETIVLDSDLNLEILDISKKTLADHWQVILMARLEIPVDTLYGNNTEGLPPASAIREALGDPLVYEHINIRQFVSEESKPAVLELLMKNFKKEILPYISHPDFSKNYAIKKYREHAKLQQSYPDEKTTL